MSRREAFIEQLRGAPRKPGVYLFRDAAEKVLYVGKARDLKARVQVYAREGADGRARLAELLARAATAEFRVTDREKEAILLEDRLVKLHQPPLNVLLKDDKACLLVHISDHPEFPRIGLARRRSRHGRFFGPYPTAGAARRARRLLMGAFQLRDCSDHTLANRSRPCLKHGLGLCSAPCVGAITSEDYAGAVQGAVEVLDGKVRDRLQAEQRRMVEASAREEYEIALRARDRIRALEALAEPQKVRLQKGRDFDVLGVDERGFFALLQYRDGEWLSTRRGHLPHHEDHAHAVSQLLTALYRGEEAELVPEVLLPLLPEDHELHEEWLRERAGFKVSLLAPARGEKRALVRMAESNARAQSGAASGRGWPQVARRLGELLDLPEPAVVDCIDVSHLQGHERVASKVRFVEGKAKPEEYRRYLVAGGEGNDDFAAMREVVARVLARAGEEGLPDLLVLDGGLGQLNAGLDSLSASGRELPLVGLAKARRGRGALQAEERLYLPGRPHPLILDAGSGERLFLEKIRDEAHRFAIGYHRRRRENLRLVLEQVPGIGPRKRMLLLDHCGGDLGKLRDADPADLEALPGIDAGLIDGLQRHLRRVMP
jgi:excinuclease ABC subunit C